MARLPESYTGTASLAPEVSCRTTLRPLSVPVVPLRWARETLRTGATSWAEATETNVPATRAIAKQLFNCIWILLIRTKVWKLTTGVQTARERQIFRSRHEASRRSSKDTCSAATEGSPLHPGPAL